MLRPSPALVVACLALLVALTGTGYATTLAVPKNSVGTPQLQRNAVSAAKVAPNAIRTGHVLDGSLLVGDFKPGQIPQGPKGDKGDKGDRGEQGARGVSGYEVVTRSSTFNVNLFWLSVPCPSGKLALGGGAEADVWGSGVGPYVARSYPADDGTGWHVLLATLPSTTTQVTVTAYAVCATVS